ncbi:hypothetical protein PES01_14200 [Pseudoalteromonas espejiana]|uniref:Uncharacterized protein n=1 Tax=Pseudoalteromonas espejiana TaxID=28107 RepID=A0A510XU71_9GAMM|nr:hypothetical protein PES01_14200 [Pseudoalteromonas espejiana]
MKLATMHCGLQLTETTGYLNTATTNVVVFNTLKVINNKKTGNCLFFYACSFIVNPIGYLIGLIQKRITL